MCAIVGIICRNPKYKAQSIVNDMLKTVQHRGPDQLGIYTKDNVSLGMARLNIIDQEKHKIPYEAFDQSAVVTYNGEIYNHDSLRQDLAERYPFKTNSDAETVLYHYLDKGVKSFLDYNGMYAFALYDNRKHQLYLVRDKAGEKPLYYTQTKSFFAFASEIKALLKIVTPVFNEECISYQAYEFNTGGKTLFKNIHCLLPGEYIKVDHSLKVTKHIYWKIWDNLIDVPDNLKKIETKLTDLLVDAIKLRTKNCVHPYGTFISGGIDSALVACIVQPDYIYTCHYPLDGYDELAYAKLVAKKLKKPLVIVRPSLEDFERTRKKIIYHLDTPCTWTSFSLWMLLEKAQHDVKIILSGDGADEIFSGYHRYHLLYHDEQIKRLDALKDSHILLERYYGSPVKRYAKVVNRCEDHKNKKVLRYLERTIQYFFSKTKGDYIHAMGMNDFYTTMQELLQFADRLNMAFSIENRSPFLDYRLIQFAFSMPSKYKLRDGTAKWIIKKVAKKFIPREIAERVDKRGFSAPINLWFGWGEKGRYERTKYKELVFNDWLQVFKVKHNINSKALL